MSVISQWQCPEEPAPLARATRLPAPSARGEERAASLVAFGTRCRCIFAAGLHFDKGRARSIFYGLEGERREGMEIARGTIARAGGSAFVVDLAAGTASVRPPLPFRGQATLEGGLGARPRWRSTIRMPFLGAASINPRGPGLFVDLDPGYDFFDPGFDLSD